MMMVSWMDVFVGFYVGYTFDFKVQVFNQWSCR